MATQPATETDFSLDAAAAVAEQEGGGKQLEGMGPWRLAWRRLKRNRVAMASLAVFFVLVACCIAAPLYAKHIAGRGPTDTNATGTIEVDGKKTFVVTPDGTPIGPGLRKEYLLGADPLGRDVMVRLLYGGRNSLFVGFMAAIITAVLAVGFGLLAGYIGGFTDGVITNMFDILWSFPVLLFAIALGTALALGGLTHRACQHPGRLALDPDRDHRRRLRAVLRPPDPRPGAVAAREGVRGRRHGAGDAIAADHVRRDPAEPVRRRSWSSAR